MSVSSTTTNLGLIKYSRGHSIRDGDIGDNMDLIDTAVGGIQALADGKIIVGNGSGAATDVDMSGDVTIINDGTTTIGADKIDPNMKNIGSYVAFEEEFVGAAPDEVATWSLNDTSSAGSPTHAYEADETAATMTLDTTDELEVCGYDFGDKLQFDIDNNPIFIARFKTSTITTNEEAVIGMCAAWNDTLDTNAAHAWVRLKANMDLLIETDDGTNDESEDSTVNMTGDTYLWVKIDFSDTADVLFYTGTDGVAWTARAPATFDMSNYTAGLQPAFAVLKASGATQPTITVDAIKVYADRP